MFRESNEKFSKEYRQNSCLYTHIRVKFFVER